MAFVNIALAAHAVFQPHALALLHRVGGLVRRQPQIGLRTKANALTHGVGVCTHALCRLRCSPTHLRPHPRYVVATKRSLNAASVRQRRRCLRNTCPRHTLHMGTVGGGATGCNLALHTWVFVILPGAAGTACAAPALHRCQVGRHTRRCGLRAGGRFNTRRFAFLSPCRLATHRLERSGAHKPPGGMRPSLACSARMAWRTAA